VTLVTEATGQGRVGKSPALGNALSGTLQPQLQQPGHRWQAMAAAELPHERESARARQGSQLVQDRRLLDVVGKALDDDGQVLGALLASFWGTSLRRCLTNGQEERFFQQCRVSRVRALLGRPHRLRCGEGAFERGAQNLVIHDRCMPLEVGRRRNAEEASHGGWLDVKHAPAPGGPRDRHAIVYFAWVVGDALSSKGFDRTTPTGRPLRPPVDHAKAVVPMPVAREGAGAVRQRDKHARQGGCDNIAAVGQQALQGVGCADPLILRAQGPYSPLLDGQEVRSLGSAGSCGRRRLTTGGPGQKLPRESGRYWLGNHCLRQAMRMTTSPNLVAQVQTTFTERTMMKKGQRSALGQGIEGAPGGAS
jgi:hypothetical protein